MGADNPNKAILVQRIGALGDVLLTTPIVRRLREELGPEAVIDITTGCPQAYEGNPHISAVNPAPRTYDRFINLDSVYENHPTMHIVDAYMEAVFGDTDGNKRVVFGIEPPPPADLIRESKVVTLHGMRGWPSRSFSNEWWDTVIKLLVDADYKPCALGGPNDYSPQPDTFVTNLVGRTSLRQATEAISQSCCFIASDSSLLHFAGATDTPIVGLFTCVKAEYRMPYRKKQLGYRMMAMTPKALSCYGCLADVPPPATFVACRRGDNACTFPEHLSPEDVVAAVKRMAL